MKIYHEIVINLLSSKSLAQRDNEVSAAHASQNKQLVIMLAYILLMMQLNNVPQ